MPRRSRTADPEELRQALIELLGELPDRLRYGTVVEQVCELVQAHHLLRDLGASIGAALAPDDSGSGRARLIAYLDLQVGKVVHTDELMIVGGIGDYPRRLREIRFELGWPLISGAAVRDMRADFTARRIAAPDLPAAVGPDEYVLLEARRDEDAPRRWELAGKLRESADPVRLKIAAFLSAARGRRVTAEELRYAARNRSDWPQAVTSLIAEGWDIDCRERPGSELPSGVYVVGAPG